MSSLIVATDETQVLVASDTLATHPNGRPFKFTSKAFIVPHLNLIMASTGLAGVLGRWFVYMNDSLIVRDIDNLDYHAPRALSILWQRCKQELSIPDDLTTSIYHFGFSETTGAIHSYRYASKEDFKSTMVPYGILVKPECTLANRFSSLDDIVAMMNEQRAIQAMKPKEDKVYVGGEINVHHLTEQGFSSFTLHRFEDYSRDEMLIYDKDHIREITS
jgi:hypothetical protein